jgi:hypothetical protein
MNLLYPTDALYCPSSVFIKNFMFLVCSLTDDFFLESSVELSLNYDLLLLHDFTSSLHLLLQIAASYETKVKINGYVKTSREREKLKSPCALLDSRRSFNLPCLFFGFACNPIQEANKWKTMEIKS